MRKLKYLIVLFVALMNWRCVNDEMDFVVYDDLLLPRILDNFDKLDLEKIFPEGCLGLESYIQYMANNTSIGYKLLSNLEFIRIYIDPSLPAGVVAYAGYGLVQIAMDQPAAELLDAALFHEFYHAYQFPVNIEKNLNAELEAYIAQWIYWLQRTDGQPQDRPIYLLNNDFTDCIKQIVNGFYDVKNNEFKVQNDFSKFSNLYLKAIQILHEHALYAGEEWQVDILSMDTIFENIIRLTK